MLFIFTVTLHHAAAGEGAKNPGQMLSDSQERNYVHSLLLFLLDTVAKLNLGSFCVKYCNNHKLRKRLKCISHGVSLSPRVYMIIRHHSQETAQVLSLVVVALKCALSL